MKIGIDARCFLGGRKSGVEEYTYQVIKNVLKRDKKNQYVLFLNSAKDFQLSWSWLKDFDNVKIKKFRWPNKLLNFFFWYLNWPKIDKMLGGVDIFWAPNWNFWGLSRKVKFVLTVHDLSFEYYPETFSWKRRWWHFFVNPRRAVKRADKIIAISRSTYDDLVNFYHVPKEKIKIIHSGIKDDYQVLNRNDLKLIEIKEKYRLPFNFIFFLGTLEPRKNIVGIVKAYEELRRENHPELDKYKLVIAGNPGWKMQKIFQVVSQSVFRRDILFIGPVAEKDKVYLYNLATVFVFPSLLEGFGFPPLEALKSGTPVIVSSNSSFPETVGRAGIMIDPDRFSEIKEAMRTLLLKRELRESFQVEGLRQAQKFSWSKTAQEYLKVWQNLAG